MTYKGKRPSERAQRRRRMISVVCGIISAVCIVGIIVMMWLRPQGLIGVSDSMLSGRTITKKKAKGVKT